MVGPSITWQTAAQSIETTPGALPSWTDVLRPTPLDEFSAWIDTDLSRLEHAFADFTTPSSMARDSAFGRITHI